MEIDDIPVFSPTAVSTDDRAAIDQAYKAQLALMYVVFLEALVQNTNVDEACQRFRKGLALARKSRDLSYKMVSE